MIKSSNAKVIFAASGTILIWASAYVGTRITVRYLSPVDLALYRFFIASLVLAFYALIIKRISLPDKKDIPFIILTGLIGIALYMFVFNSAQKRITAATGAFLIGSAPVFTSIFSLIFLRERIKLMTILGIIVSFCGITIICFSEKNGISFNPGVIIMAAAAILISLYNIMVKKLAKKYTSLQIITYAFISGTFFLLFFAPSLLNEIRDIPFSIHLTVIYLGLFPAAIAYVLWAFALSGGNTAQVASFMYVTPLLTIIIGWFWIKEIPGILSILGGLIIIAGVIITNFTKFVRS